MSGGAFPKRETTFGQVTTRTYKRKSQKWPFSHFPPPPMAAKSDNSIPLKPGMLSIAGDWTQSSRTFATDWIPSHCECHQGLSVLDKCAEFIRQFLNFSHLDWNTLIVGSDGLVATPCISRIATRIVTGAAKAVNHGSWLPTGETPNPEIRPCPRSTGASDRPHRLPWKAEMSVKWWLPGGRHYEE